MVFKLLLRGLPWVGEDAWRKALLTSKVLFFLLLCLCFFRGLCQIRRLRYRTLLLRDFFLDRHSLHALEDHILWVGVVTRS